MFAVQREFLKLVNERFVKIGCKSTANFLN